MTKEPPFCNGQGGVTLIETLVALFVVALMATAGAIMTLQSLRGARAVETRGQAASNLSIALSTISADLNAYTKRASQDESFIEPPTMFAGYAPRFDGRIMVFVRNAWPNPSREARGDLQRVEYVFEDGSLIRRSWAAPDPAASTRVENQVLLDNIQSIEARFGRLGDWRSEWIVLPAGNEPVPQKVELLIQFDTEDTLTARYIIGAGG